MSSDPFKLESMPRSGPRRRRIRRDVLARLHAEHEESERTSSKEPDAGAFKARAFWIISGLDLVDALDPLDGHTLESVVETLSGRIEAATNALRGNQPGCRAFWRRDLTVWQANRLVATLRIAEGEPVVTVYRPA
jgi:hypothetical protein